VAAGNVLGLLEDAVRGAGEAVRGVAGDTDETGTTLTALLWTGAKLALAHVGDCRAYLLRDGELSRITRDHRVRPESLLLLKALAGGADPVPDVRLQEVREGDRYLLCSDGLTEAVAEERIKELLAADDAVRTLIDEANAAGGPDNVSCVVADIVAATA
jgi:protein phosphatase